MSDAVSTEPKLFSRLEVSEMRPPDASEIDMGRAKVLGIFSLRVGPVLIRGVKLINRPNASKSISMPRCREIDAMIYIMDSALRRDIKTEAKRIYELMLDEIKLR